jgi:putative nucleotidyltransferase with HDIG domain
VSRSFLSSRAVRRAAIIVGCYLVLYALLDGASLMFRTDSVASIWYLSDGVSLALLLVFGVRYAPAIVLSALITNFVFFPSPAAPALLAVWAVIFPLPFAATATLLRRRLQVEIPPRRLRDVAWLILGCLALSVTLAGLFVLTVLFSRGLVPTTPAVSAEWPAVAFRWWIGEAIGLVLVTPLLVVSVAPWLRVRLGSRQQRARRRPPMGVRSIVEASAQLLSIAIVVAAVFGVEDNSGLPLFYLCFVPLIWITLRHGLRGATLAIALIDTAAILVARLSGLPSAHIADLQLFMLTLGLTGLMVGAVVDERRESETQSRRRARELAASGDFSLALVGTLDLDQIYERLYLAVRSDLLDAKEFIVSSYDPEDRLIRAEFLISEGTRIDASGFPPIPLEEEGYGTQSRVIRIGEPLYFPDFREAIAQTKRNYTFNEKGSVVEGLPPPGAEDISTNSALLVPLKVAGQTIGVVQLQSNRRDAYTEEAKSLLYGLANVAAVAIQNAQLYKRIEKALETTIQTLGLTTEMRDPYTAGHQRRVANLACAVAKEMHVEEQSIRGIRAAGLVHDIGKLSIPAEILSKPSALSPLEFDLVKEHAQTGYDILKGIVFPWPVAEAVLQHHERLDGSGYPRGLRGDEIVLAARILAVADVVEAMASHRPYRAALGIDRALGEIARGAGTVYDDQAASACLRLFAERRFAFEGEG